MMVNADIEILVYRPELEGHGSERIGTVISFESLNCTVNVLSRGRRPSVELQGSAVGPVERPFNRRADQQEVLFQRDIDG